MTRRTYEVIVLGTGGIGSAALWQLAKRGKSVLGLDVFPPGHDRGSSHGQTRVIRQAYFEHPDYVPLVLQSFALWAEIEHVHSRPLFFETGLLQVGPADGEVIAGVLLAARKYGLSIEQLSSRTVRQRFPQFAIPPGMSAVYESRAGYLLVEQCVQAQLAAAVAAGADWEQQQVLRWDTFGKHVEVSTAQSKFVADQLVIAAGPWTTSVAPTIGENVRVLGKHLHWYRADPERFGQKSGCPIYLFEVPEGVFYGFPMVGNETIKVGEHTGGTEIQLDPNEFPRDVDPWDRRRVESFMANYLRGVPLPPLQEPAHKVCFYSMSRDAHFYVGQLPNHPRVCVAAGMSGHGFKFAPVIGQALADLVCDGSTELPIGFLACDR